MTKAHTTSAWYRCMDFAPSSQRCWDDSDEDLSPFLCLTTVTDEAAAPGFAADRRGLSPTDEAGSLEIYQQHVEDLAGQQTAGTSDDDSPPAESPCPQSAEGVSLESSSGEASTTTSTFLSDGEPTIQLGAYYRYTDGTNDVGLVQDARNLHNERTRVTEELSGRATGANGATAQGRWCAMPACIICKELTPLGERSALQCTCMAVGVQGVPHGDALTWHCTVSRVPRIDRRESRELGGRRRGRRRPTHQGDDGEDEDELSSADDEEDEDESSADDEEDEENEENDQVTASLPTVCDASRDAASAAALGDNAAPASSRAACPICRFADLSASPSAGAGDTVAAAVSRDTASAAALGDNAAPASIRAACPIPIDSGDLATGEYDS